MPQKVRLKVNLSLELVMETHAESRKHARSIARDQVRRICEMGTVGTYTLREAEPFSEFDDLSIEVIPEPFPEE